MLPIERTRTDLCHSCDDLKTLILEHPDLPIVLYAGADAALDDYTYTSCSDVRAYLGEFLDCNQMVDQNMCFEDREDFREALEDMLCDAEENMAISDAEFDAKVDAEMAQYDPYWRKCIIVYVNN